MHPPAANLDDRLYRSDDPSLQNREISSQISTLFRNDRWFANRFVRQVGRSTVGSKVLSFLVSLRNSAL